MEPVHAQQDALERTANIATHVTPTLVKMEAPAIMEPVPAQQDALERSANLVSPDPQLTFWVHGKSQPTRISGIASHKRLTNCSATKMVPLQ